MNKKILAVVLIVVLVIATITAAIIGKNLSNKANNTPVSDGTQETTIPPEQVMQHPDRLAGILESDYEAKDNTIVVTYGKAGTLKRIFGSNELMSSVQKYKEESVADINGNKVTLKGKNGKVYTAAWVENYNSYLIELNPEGEGIDKDVMAKYVKMSE